MSLIIVDNESSYSQQLIALFKDESPRVIHYKELAGARIAKNDTVILTGGHGDPILWHKKTYAEESKLVKKHRGPIIGICLGFELIAHVYGSHLHLLNERRKGEVELRPTKRATVHIPEQVTVFENHNWSVQTIKHPLVAVAASDYGIEIIRHARKPIYGMQFHPEMSSPDAVALFKEILREVRRRRVPEH